LLESNVFIPLAVRVSNCTFLTAFTNAFILFPFRLKWGFEPLFE